MAGADPRPAVWVGHVIMNVPDVKASRAFCIAIGMRDVVLTDDGVSVLELRGGTHLVLLPSKDPIAADTPAPFDLMVDDISATREQFVAAGFKPGEMQEGSIHEHFTLKEPGGHVFTVNSTHVTDQPV